MVPLVLLVLNPELGNLAFLIFIIRNLVLFTPQVLVLLLRGTSFASRDIPHRRDRTRRSETVSDPDTLLYTIVRLTRQTARSP